MTGLARLVRYGLVGIASNGLGYLAYLGLTTLGLPPKVTMTALYATATGIAFFANRSFTFVDHGRMGPAGLRFVLIYLAGWVLNLILLETFVDKLGYPHSFVQGIAIVIVAAVLFVLQRHFVFRHFSE
ncbi:GtrA family protein [Agrobacterium sp. YIC 4121]|uniref:GtrA family protein n=1 Tax=Agrobacterium sp. YIC 4121 TaxID=1923829 RepID=UPI00098EB78D|nr:GtrA family protein [Agrobacterium sp. YIC 4121]OOO28598.1 hypothetical protein BTE54_18680 [Agrobacterium sp. YIC 4121]